MQLILNSRVSKTKQTQVAMVVSNQVSGKDASMTDGPVGCTLGAEGLHLGSFCAALSRYAMLLKHISVNNVDGDPPPLLLPLDCMGLIHCMLCNRRLEHIA